MPEDELRFQQQATVVKVSREQLERERTDAMAVRQFPEKNNPEATNPQGQAQQGPADPHQGGPQTMQGGNGNQARVQNLASMLGLDFNELWQFLQRFTPVLREAVMVLLEQLGWLPAQAQVAMQQQGGQHGMVVRSMGEDQYAQVAQQFGVEQNFWQKLVERVGPVLMTILMEFLRNPILATASGPQGQGQDYPQGHHQSQSQEPRQGTIQQGVSPEQLKPQEQWRSQQPEVVKTKQGEVPTQGKTQDQGNLPPDHQRAGQTSQVTTDQPKKS